MHSASTIEEVFLDMISSAKGEVLGSIGDKHGVALATMYLWRKQFKELAKMAPEVVRSDGRLGGRESSASGPDEEKQVGEEKAPKTEATAKPPTEKVRGRQRDGYYSLPVVAEMLGKSKNEVRTIIRDYKIQPEAILVKRPKRNVPGYSEETIQKIKDRESKNVDSVELRQILGLAPHTYRRFLEYIALLAKEPLYSRRFSRIKHTLDVHKDGCTYRFDRGLIPDFRLLAEKFAEENDGRKRNNWKMKKYLRSLSAK